MVKTIWIAFPHGGRIPASVIDAKKDLRVPALKPVEVPAIYGRQLIDDHFAVETAAPQSETKEAAAAVAEPVVPAAPIDTAVTPAASAEPVQPQTVDVETVKAAAQNAVAAAETEEATAATSKA